MQTGVATVNLQLSAATPRARRDNGWFIHTDDTLGRIAE